MKLIRIILSIFVVSLVCSVFGVKAEGYAAGYANVSVPAFGGTFVSEEKYKNINSPQTIETTNMSTSMKARTYGLYSNVGYSSYVNLVKNASQNLNSYYAGPNYYKLEIKCQSTNWLTEHYWGTWKYNWPL